LIVKFEASCTDIVGIGFKCLAYFYCREFLLISSALQYSTN